MPVVTKDLNTLQRGLAARLVGLAEEALSRGEVGDAERLYREVLHFLQLVLEAEHVEIAKALYKLAYILEFQDKNVESIELLGRARSIMRNSGEQARTVDAVFTPFIWERTS
jgi:hypothetical protein